MSRPLRVAAHDLPFRVGIGVVPSATLGTGLAGAIVAVFADRLVRSQFFWPVIIVLVQAALNIIDQKNTIAAACRSSSLPICLLSDWGELISHR
jgi:hypothetical protein